MNKTVERSYNPKPPSPCMCLNIRRASRAVTEFYEKILEPCGLKVTQYSLLRNLGQVEPVKITELANFMRIDRTTLNRNMKPLAEAGLIEIHAGQDPRSKEIRLTNAGKLLVANATVLWNQAQTDLQEYLGECDRKQFDHVMSKLEALAP